jgi:hypothetical protein
MIDVAMSVSHAVAAHQTRTLLRELRQPGHTAPARSARFTAHEPGTLDARASTSRLRARDGAARSQSSRRCPTSLREAHPTHGVLPRPAAIPCRRRGGRAMQNASTPVPAARSATRARIRPRNSGRRRPGSAHGGTRAPLRPCDGRVLSGAWRERARSDPPPTRGTWALRTSRGSPTLRASHSRW